MGVYKLPKQINLRIFNGGKFIGEDGRIEYVGGVMQLECCVDVSSITYDYLSNYISSVTKRTENNIWYRLPTRSISKANVGLYC